MSLNQIHHSALNSSWRQVFLLWSLLACVFASCSIHASQSFESMMDNMVVATMDDEHDCCDTQEQCCEQPDVAISHLMIDLPVAYISAIKSIDLALNADLPQVCLLIDKPPTGPPIHLKYCRFTI